MYNLQIIDKTRIHLYHVYMQVPYVLSLTDLKNSSYVQEDFIGRKASALVPLVRLGLPVPSFFVVTTRVFNEFLNHISTVYSPATIEELKDLIVKTPLPPLIVREIKKEYSKLNLLGNSWVAVRSSISAPDYSEYSFSGVLDTYLNVKGIDEVEEAIKRVYASLLNDVALTYIKDNKIKLSKIALPIIVQKMVNSEVSGVLYSYNPITEQDDSITIQAVFGLGDTINTGEINPDVYIIDKLTNSIVEKKIMPQYWLETRAIDDSSGHFHNKKVQLSPVWQFSQKLTEKQITELSKVALLLEEELKTKFILEWTLTNNQFYFLQLKFINPKDLNPTLNVKKTGDKDIKSKDITQIDNLKSNKKVSTKTSANKKYRKLKESDILLAGINIVKGAVQGKVYVLTKRQLLEEEKLDEMFSKEKKYIFVTDFFDKDLEKLLPIAEGFITDTGGINSDVALILKEHGIPTITSTRVGTKLLTTGQNVLLDANAGVVKKPQKIKTKDAKAKQETDNCVTQDKSLQQTTKQALPSNNKELYKIDPTGIVLFSVDPQWPYWLIIEASYLKELKVQTLPQYNKITVILSKDEVKKNVVKKLLKLKSLAREGIVIAIKADGIEEFIKIKSELGTLGIRRSSQLKIVPIVYRLLDLVEIKKYIKPFIDGIIFDLPSLFIASGGSGDFLQNSEFIQFLKPYIEQIKSEKYDIVGTFVNSEVSSKFIKLTRVGINMIFSTSIINHPVKTNKVLEKLSRSALA